MTEDVAILVIGTGHYAELLPGMVQSFRLHFLPGLSKRFYIFTDGEAPAGDDVRRVYREHKPWPADTLERYGMFLGVADELRRHKFAFFSNANMRAVAPIGREILPTDERPLVVVRHPRNFTPEQLAEAIEQRPESCAFMERVANAYVAGGFNGGRVAEFLAMSATIDEWQRKDAAAGIVPPWHDESYLNAYRGRYAWLFRVLCPAYLYPEGWLGDYPARLICLDKSRFFKRKNFR